MNCALWSAEVFEDDDGSLKNVHMAVLRGKQLVGLFLLQKFPIFPQCSSDGHLQPVVLYLNSAVKSVRNQGPQLAAASPLAPATITSCVPASATVFS